MAQRCCGLDETGHTDTETVSFSLTIGITPIDNSSENVFFAFRYLVLWIPSQLVLPETAGTAAHVGDIHASQ